MKTTTKNFKFIYVVVITVVICLSTLYYSIYKPNAYKVLLNDKCIGTVKDKDFYFKIDKEMKNSLITRFGYVDWKDNIDFKRVKLDEKYSTSQEIKRNFLFNSNSTVNVYEISINGENITLVDNNKEAKKVIDILEKEYKDALKLQDIEHFKVNNLVFKKHKSYISKIPKSVEDTNDKAAKQLLKNKDILSIELIGNIEQKTDIEPYTVIKPSGKILKGNRKVESNGEKGQKYVYEKITIKDNRIIDKKVTGEKVIKPSKDKVILVGVKNPAIVGMAFLSKPSRGGISSGFGLRWGKMHKGIDIAAALGSPICSAYDGKVRFAGWQDGYGNVVIVDHGNGYETRYAHCSKILVKNDEKVKENQIIARVGSTGRSTGPHVHFEVRKNNIPLNPQQYIK